MLSESSNVVPQNNKPQPIVEKVVEKVESIESVQPVIVATEQLKVQPKIKRKYTKKEGVDYGNPKFKKSKIRETKQTIGKNETRIEKQIEKPKQPSKLLFYAGISIGIILTTLGLVYAWKKFKEYAKTNEEAELIKKLNEQLELEAKQKVAI